MYRFLVLLCLSTSAVALPEEERVHGGIALVNLGTSAQGSTSARQQAPYVNINKRRITVVKNDDNWFAVIGLSILNPSKKINMNILWPDKTAETRSINIGTKKYAESYLTIQNKDKVTPPKKHWDRLAHENKRIGRAKRYWLNETPDFAFQLPAQGRFSSLFGLKRFLNNIPKNPHRGLDIAAPIGTPVYAPSKGIVIDTGDFFYTGNTVLLAHGASLVSMYSHLSRVDVKKGDKIDKGDMLGAIGATGRVTGPHLHWSVGLNGVWVNPVYFLSPVDRPQKALRK